VELSLTNYTHEAFTVLSVAGEIDVYTAPKLRDALVALSEGGITQIIVDLSDIEFLDSTGLGVLVGAHKRALASGGVFRVVCSAERILKIFRITGLHDVFALYPDIDDAIAAAAPSGQ
jgi:anti-sigma B factor antagonist